MKKKTTFLTKYELFEYVVMLFELCNAFETFQTFINKTLRKYFDDFCTKYLNDIFIYNNMRKKHKKHVVKMLKRFIETKLYFDIDKCEFFVTKIKYLNFIITTKNVKMNFKKVKIIVNWKTFKCLKNFQIFLKFVNFYKKFIYNYSNIIFSLTLFIKNNDKSFVFFLNFE